MQVNDLSNAQELKILFCDKLKREITTLTGNRNIFSKSFEIALKHTGLRAQETNDALRLALATPEPIVAMILDGAINYKNSNQKSSELVLEGKFLDFEYIDIFKQVTVKETFAARLVIKENMRKGKKFLVISFYPDRQCELDLTHLPEVRHEVW